MVLAIEKEIKSYIESVIKKDYVSFEDGYVFGCSTPEVNTPCISHVKLSTKLA